jgi:hypothetical protein
MAAAKRNFFSLFRVSRKLVLLSGSFLFVLGASGTAALVFAPANMIPGFQEEAGGHCRTVYQSEFRRGKEKRLIALVAGDDADPRERVKTGLRIARHLSEKLDPDLVIVQIADIVARQRGPNFVVPRLVLKSSTRPCLPGRLRCLSPGKCVTSMRCRPRTGYYFGNGSICPKPSFEAIDHEIERCRGLRRRHCQ